MKIKIRVLVQWALVFAGVSYLLACTHTIQGVSQDMHEDTAYTSDERPTSPPPLETPPS